MVIPATAMAAEPDPRRDEPHLSVGFGVEHFGKNARTFGRVRDLLLGTTVAFRAWGFEPHLEVLGSPVAGSWENLRLLGSFGTRYYLPRPSWLDLSIGWSIHAEARLEDHYWLASFSPIEVGATVFRRRSFRIQVFTGLRAGFAGDLLNSFLVDPNGFHDEAARDALDDAKLHAPWRLFMRVVFSHRIH